MSDPKDILEKVIKSDPVDRTARMVTQRGEHWEAGLNKQALHSEVPIECRRFNKHDALPDLTGRRVGRLTVQGLMYRSEASIWVVRCDCGMYEVRKRKALLNMGNQHDACGKCRCLRQRKRHQHYKVTGEDKPEWDF